MKEFLSENNVAFDYVEITESMRSLIKFLRLRDTHPAFEEIRKAGRAGLPAIVTSNGEKILFGKPELDELR